MTFRSDDEQGARLAVEWLRKLGRRRIVHITGPRGFRLGAASAPTPIRAIAGSDAASHARRLVGRAGATRRSRQHMGAARRDAGRHLLRQRPDRAGRRRCAARARRQGARDVSVIGFDNWEIVAAQTRPPLTTVDMNLKELGRQAGTDGARAGGGPAVEPGVRKLPCRLVVRQSCGGDTRETDSNGREGDAPDMGGVRHDQATACCDGPVASLCWRPPPRRRDRSTCGCAPASAMPSRRWSKAYNASHENQVELTEVPIRGTGAEICDRDRRRPGARRAVAGPHLQSGLRGRRPARGPDRLGEGPALLQLAVAVARQARHL